MPATDWPTLEPNINSILAAESHPIARLAAGDVAAIVIRQAFPKAECESLVQYLIDEGQMYDSGDTQIDDKAIDVDRADRYTQQGLNPTTTARRRIDIGTSLGNLGDDQEHFLSDSGETHTLFDRLFGDRPDPIAAIHDSLSALSPGKKVLTAYEPNGRQYGPAIFRVHYGGYTYGPHFDSVRQREFRSNYAVHKFSRQLAGVLCVQNSTRVGVTAQGILHRQFWNEDVDPYIKQSRFDEWKAEHDVTSVQVDLKPGDLYFFNTEMIHEVPGVDGDLPRIVLATFIGYSDDEDEIMVWS